MTAEEAVTEEICRYLDACRDAVYHAGPDGSVLLERRSRRLAHIHALTIRRLRKGLITPHESIVHATPSVQAFSH